MTRMGLAIMAVSGLAMGVLLGAGLSRADWMPTSGQLVMTGLGLLIAGGFTVAKRN